MDKLFYGNVYTMNRDFPHAEAIGVKDGAIVFVGSRAEAEKQQAKEILDFGDCTILPGFIDTHVHVVPAGPFMGGVDVSGAKNLAELKKIMCDFAAQKPAGTWVFGTNFQDKNIAEKRFPRKEELDEISQQHPIMLCHNDVHPYSFNTLGLQALAPDPSIEGVEVDSHGNLTGFITDPACISMLNNLAGIFTDEEILQGFKNINNYAIANGFTTIFSKDTLHILRLYNRYKQSLSIEMIPMCLTKGCSDWETLNALLAEKGLGENICVCVFVDGSFDCYSAAVIEPYAQRPTEFGILINSDEELYRYMLEVHKNGLQFSCHAIGDHGIDQVLRVYERVLKEMPRDNHRHRIEHFEMPTKAAIKKAARLGCALAMQPLLIEICEGMDFSGYSSFIGDRAARCSPYRSILDEGLLVGGGTDFPVTPMKALHGARICMQNPAPEESITLLECLELYTVNAAKVGFLENRKGMIKEGMDADMVVLDKNPFAVTVADLSDIQVKHTVCQGEVVFSK